jgi:AmiR/NasT family two-component response regulator
MGPFDPYEEIVQLRRALATRDVIGQAKGVLMERHGLTSDQAFRRLVEMSQRSNAKLADVAEYLVELRIDDPSTHTDVDAVLPE